jgi:glutathione peroxidase
MHFYDFSVKKIDGTSIPLKDYEGKVLVVVNVASKCGFTPQYEGLEKLYRKYRDEGLIVLGFPCNQFGAQEPGDEKEIAQFCSLHYEVSFPLFSKIDVNGPNASPFYEYLKKECKGLLGTEAIKWNFTKFLINRKGQVVERYAPQTKPEALESEIQKLLK